MKGRGIRVFQPFRVAILPCSAECTWKIHPTEYRQCLPVEHLPFGSSGFLIFLDGKGRLAAATGPTGSGETPLVPFFWLGRADDWQRWDPQTKEECAQRTSCYEFRSQASTVRSVLNQGQMYHSNFVNKEGNAKACGCPLLPLKSHIKGPTPVSDQDTNDVIDEAIMFFRANIFFRNFNIQSSADKLLIYLTLYINIALKRLEGCRTLAEGTNAIINLGLEKVPVPGEPDFPLGSLFSLPQSKQEAELFRNYLRQLREETSGRLVSRAYRPNGTPNKWWLAFAKRKFISIVHHSTSS